MQFSQPIVASGINEFLPTLAATRFDDKHLLRAVALLLPDIARNRDIELSAHFWALWDRLVERAAREEDLPQNDEWTQAATYHPAGVLALALVTAFSRVNRKARERLGEFAPRFDRLLGDGVGLCFARIVLASHLAYLHAVDPEWTTRNVVSRMDWERSEEAAPLWQAYSFQLRISPDLWSSLNREYFQGFEGARLARIGRARDNFVCLLAIVGIDLSPAAPLAQEMHDLLVRMEPRDRVAIARWIWMRVAFLGHGKPSQDEQAKLREAADEAWRRHIGPWLRSVWPTEPAAQSPGSSANFGLTAIATGDAFSEAVRSLRSMLILVDNPGTLMRSLAGSSHPDTHPRESLDLFGQTVAPDQVIDYSGLGILLERLRRADPDLANEASFKVFENAVRRFETARSVR